MSKPRRALDYRIDPYDLLLFAAVLERRTITAAAQTMNLSLAAASARVAALEHRVGAKLLTRSKTGVQPTEAGLALARRSHRVLNELDSLYMELAAFGRGLRGTVRLLCNTAAMAELLPPRLGRFLQEHPDIDLELRELSSEGVLEALRRGVADVGIVADYVETSGLAVQTWIDDELVALIPAGRRDRRSKTLRFAQLLEMPFVGLSAESGLSRFLSKQAARSGRLPHHRVRVSSFDAVAQIVEAGVGVAVMPLRAARRWSSAKVQIASLNEPWARRSLLICSTAQAETMPRVQSLISALLSSSDVLQ